MTKPRPLFIYDPGSYDQTYVIPSRRMEDTRVQFFVNAWLQGKQPHWLARQGLGEDGRQLTPKAIRAHARRMEAQGIIPAGTGARPGQPHYTGQEPVGWAGNGMLVVQHPGCYWRGDARKGRPTRDQKAMSDTDSIDGGRPAARDPNWYANMLARQARQHAENRQTLADIAPDAQQLAQRQPLTLPDGPAGTATVSRLPRPEPQHDPSDWGDIEETPTPSSASESTRGDHEERIRPHGAEHAEPERETMLQEGDSGQTIDQEEGTTNASTEARPTDQPRHRHADQLQDHSDDAREANGKPDRTRPQRRRTGADETRKRPRQGTRDRRDKEHAAGTENGAEQHSDRDSEPGD